MTMVEPTILFEDAAILVVDKPSGMIVHPAPGHTDGALTAWAVARCPEMARVGSEERPGVVHRLDLETSGVLVLAKTDAAYRALRRQFESHTGVGKKYLAVLHGAPKPPKGTINEPVGRDRLSAVSHYETLGRVGSLALVEFSIETGRMHQIRLHAKALGHPVVGDSLYGDRAKDRSLRRRPTRLLLHAVELSFLHPATSRRVVFVAPPPPAIVYPGM